MSNTKPLLVNEGYNLLEITHEFRSFLIAGNKSKATIKNYLSDLRHFLGWLQNNTKLGLIPEITKLNKLKILEYRNLLVGENTPSKTINRRLSMLRMFFSFCISQQWLKENPAKNITNIDARLINSKDSFDGILSEYLQEKELSGESKKNIRYIKSSLNEFANIINLSHKLYET